MISSPFPSSPIRRSAGLSDTLLNDMGLLWFPRIPRLFHPPATVTPGSSFRTRKTLGPGPAVEPQLATIPSATPALVTQLFSALRVTVFPWAVALETGAQN